VQIDFPDGGLALEAVERALLSPRSRRRAQPERRRAPPGTSRDTSATGWRSFGL
jgi:hypothetical protein